MKDILGSSNNWGGGSIIIGGVSYNFLNVVGAIKLSNGP
jgi:hypothetical protein